MDLSGIPITTIRGEQTTFGDLTDGKAWIAFEFGARFPGPWSASMAVVDARIRTAIPQMGRGRFSPSSVEKLFFAGPIGRAM